MQEEMAIVAAVAVKKSAFSSSLLTSMVIFQDPAYFIIAIIGAFVSMGSAFYDFSKAKKVKELHDEECIKSVWLELSKSFVIGSLITVASFMVFTGMASKGFDSLGIPFLSEMLPSFWFIVTLIIATEAVAIWNTIQSKFKRWAV